MPIVNGKLVSGKRSLPRHIFWTPGIRLDLAKTEWTVLLLIVIAQRDGRAVRRSCNTLKCDNATSGQHFICQHICSATIRSSSDAFIAAQVTLRLLAVLKSAESTAVVPSNPLTYGC